MQQNVVFTWARSNTTCPPSAMLPTSRVDCSHARAAASLLLLWDLPAGGILDVALSLPPSCGVKQRLQFLQSDIFINFSLENWADISGRLTAVWPLILPCSPWGFPPACPLSDTHFMQLTSICSSFWYLTLFTEMHLYLNLVITTSSFLFSPLFLIIVNLFGTEWRCPSLDPRTLTFWF